MNRFFSLFLFLTTLLKLSIAASTMTTPFYFGASNLQKLVSEAELHSSFSGSTKAQQKLKKDGQNSHAVFLGFSTLKTSSFFLLSEAFKVSHLKPFIPLKTTYPSISIRAPTAFLQLT